MVNKRNGANLGFENNPWEKARQAARLHGRNGI